MSRDDERMHVDPELPAERMRLLLEQLLEECGTNVEVSRRTGLQSDLISKLRKDPRRSLNVKTLAQAVQRLDLDANFFFSPELGKNPRYDHHLRRRDKPPFWDEFLANYSRTNELTADDLDRIRNVLTDTTGITSWQSWTTVASWVLDLRGRER
jgi:hypothetical protein